jgi:hypothetical protein
MHTIIQFWLENMKERNSLEEPDIEGRIKPTGNHSGVGRNKVVLFRTFTVEITVRKLDILTGVLCSLPQTLQRMWPEDVAS